MKKILLTLVGVICSLGMWAQTSEEYKADDETSTSKGITYTGTLFKFESAGSTVTSDKSTATANNKSGKTFTKGFLPAGTTSSTAYTITASSALSKIIVYYTMSNSSFSSKDQSKGGSLIYQIGDNDPVTCTAVEGSNKVAYADTIAPTAGIASGTTIGLYSSANRLVVFSVVAVSASTDPTINASNVSIAATATSGSISYGIMNAVDGATVSASTTDTWLSDIAVDATNKKVTFTSTKNTTDASRTATVTLTYKNGDTELATKAVTVTQAVASSDKLLTEVKYSNGFNAFITDATDEADGTVKAYYLEGTTAPTISSATVSDNASYAVSDNVLTVTAENGTTAKYNITLEAVAPYTGKGKTFDGTETWIKSGGVYTTTSGSGSSAKTYYAWVINKQATTDNRIRAGRTRIYFFVDDAKSITLSNPSGTSLNTARDIKVYVNGVEDNTVTSMPAYNATNTASITITTNGTAMVEISSNQTSGDTGWGAISIPVTLNAYGYATFSNASEYKVSGATAYTATVSGTTVTLSPIEDNIIPAGDGVVLKGEANANVTFTASATDKAKISDNALLTTNGASVGSYDWVLSGSIFKHFTGTKFDANKAYLHFDSDPFPGAKTFTIVFDEFNPTAVKNVEAADVTVSTKKFFKNGQLYIQGAKGTFNATGARVK